MAKPVGSACNLDWNYCYYLGKEHLARGLGAGRMNDETLELFIKQFIDDATGDQVLFSWQGGKPTLLGLVFFAKSSPIKRNMPSLASGSKTICRPTGHCWTTNGARF